MVVIDLFFRCGYLIHNNVVKISIEYLNEFSFVHLGFIVLMILFYFILIIAVISSKLFLIGTLTRYSSCDIVLQ